MKMSNNSGFTLIEIIVVLIIVGILAAIALPNMFANVTKSKGSTAVAAMDGIKSEIEACAAQNNTTPDTVTGKCLPGDFGLPDTPATATNGFWFDVTPSTAPYMIQNSYSGTQVPAAGTPSAGNLTYSIIAYVITTGVDNYIITLTRGTAGTFTCSAPTAGPYAGVC